MRVTDLLAVSARRYPNRPAVTDQERTVTYVQYQARCIRLANAVRGCGAQPGDRIAVLAHNSVAYAELVVGLALAGVVTVHVSDRLDPGEIGHLLVDSQAQMVIYDAELADLLGEALERSGWRGALPAVVIGRESDASDALEYEAWLERAGSHAPPLPDALAPFYLGYTSGTTGRPKGARITHASRVLTAICACAEYQLGEADVTLMCTPMHHGGPLVFVLTSLVQGGHLVIMPRFDTEGVLLAIGRHGVTNMFVVPTILSRLVATPARHDVSSLRVLVSNAAPLPSVVKEATLERFPGVALHEFYGSTEAGIVTNLRPADQLRKVRCAGQPFMLTEVAVLDENGEPCAVDEVGELFSRSPFLFDGYHGRPEATAAAMRDGMVTAGDLARVDEEGYIYIVDRKQDMIISGGVNIYPLEIEEALLRHPSVSEAAVIGVPDPEWGERVKAFVVLEADSQLADAVVAEATATLASFKRPKLVETRTALPRNATGKLLKRQLRDEAWQGQEAKI